MTDNERHQDAYCAQLRFLGAMHQLNLLVTSGDVRRTPEGRYTIRLGAIEAAALNQLSELLEGVVISRRIASVLVTPPEGGYDE